MNTKAIDDYKDELITRRAVMESLTKEYNRRRTNDGLRLAWIEGAVDDTPAAKPSYRWIPITEALPETDEDGYSEPILISCENFDLPTIGHYEVDKNGDGAFYDGDDDRTLMSYGLVVNAWMPLTEPYRTEGADDR